MQPISSNTPFRNLKGQNTPVVLHPDPLLAADRLSVSIIERFLSKIEPCGDCLIWRGAIGGTKEYPSGRLLRGKRKGGNIAAVRVSWLVYNGEIPICKSVMQDCPFGNELCVHPNHLRLASPEPVRHVQRFTAHRPLTKEQEARFEMLCTQAGTTKQRILDSLVITHKTPEWMRPLGFSETFAQRFWDKVEKTDSCHIWKAGKDACGYGHIGKGSNQPGNLIGAHIAAMMMHTGKPIPEGMHVLHNCPGGDNPACVNPNHLWIGTIRQNNYDARQKHEARRGNKRHWTTKISDDAVEQMHLRIAAGHTKVSIANEFHVSVGHVRQLLSGRRHNSNYFKIAIPGTIPHGTRTGNTLSQSQVICWPVDNHS